MPRQDGAASQVTSCCPLRPGARPLGAA